jgi:hypothetical protein
MKYELIEQNDNNENIYGRIDDDGLCRVTCTEDNPDYQAWLESVKEAPAKK